MGYNLGNWCSCCKRCLHRSLLHQIPFLASYTCTCRTINSLHPLDLYCCALGTASKATKQAHSLSSSNTPTAIPSYFPVIFSSCPETLHIPSSSFEGIFLSIRIIAILHYLYYEWNNTRFQLNFTAFCSIHSHIFHANKKTSRSIPICRNTPIGINTAFVLPLAKAIFHK